EPGVWIVGGVLPTASAQRRWADQACFRRHCFVTPDQRTGLWINAIDPRSVLGKPPNLLDVTGLLIQDGDEASLVQVNELVLPALVDGHYLVSRIVIPGIIGDFLMIP